MVYVGVDDGVRLYVRDTAGPGRPVVLVPGFGMDHSVWEGQAELLAPDHRVLCVDQRGHGRSDKPPQGYEVERLAADLRAVLERLDVTDCVVVGWSFGGQVAFRLAAGQPARVARLVLVGSNGVRASRSPDFPFGRTADRTEGPLIEAERRDRVSARRETIAAGFHRQPGPDVLERLVRCSLAMPSAAAVACYRSMLRTDLIGDIGKVTMPVMQIIGAADPVHSAKGAHWLNERLSDAELVELDDCGHYPMIESADAFNAALRRFVAG